MDAHWRARRLAVSDVRCWSRAALDLPDGLVVLAGPNGAGKTSLVEALVMACLGVSCRTSREQEMVRRGAGALHVRLDLAGPDGERRRDIGYQPGLGRRLALDGEPVRSLGAWRARGAVLVFLPDELRAVKGPPAARRRHLDRLLEAAAPGYADDLAGYQAALAQRNALLRRVRAGVTGADGLPPWEARLAALGARLARDRRAALTALAGPFARLLADLGGGPGGVLALEPSPAALAGVPDEEIEGALLAMLAAARDRDVRAAQTLAGPHRDDVLVGQDRDGATADLRRLGSQGEQRTAVLALLLAHREHLAGLGAAPVLVLDDVLSELDPVRRGRLLDAVGPPGQSLLTTADPAAASAAADRGARVVEVREGRLAA
ncbi:MAG: DNA replication and repair protein RecF [Thermoleophilia bacterium]|nr:DNA replication and repair protein RecF [Thermoleophilia bacterium]